MRSEPALRYGTVAQLLHWGMFALIAAQWLVGQVMDELPKGGTPRAFAFATHGSLGILVLLLIVARASWTVAHPMPLLDGPAWQRAAARVAHVALYALLIALPVTGYLTYGAQGHATAFFGLEIPSALGRDRATARSLEQVHAFLADALLTVVALHAAAALWHHFVLRDATLTRMLPRRRAAPSVAGKSHERS